MFSSLSSFLPTALQPNQPQAPDNAPQIDVDDEEEEDQGPDTTTKAEHHGKKEKKEKGPHETFIFVRPPPAKSNHPLNLQVQLVPPNSRQRRMSTDSGIDTDRESTAGVPLSRTPSATSEASSYSTSGYASTSSFASYSSTASGASGRRMIIPLYNLQAHNVMTNTIVDAGTDAKIAKFHKRGLEMIDLAVLEPIEVWLSPPGTHIPGPGTTPAAPVAPGGGTSSARGSLDDSRLRQRLSGVFLKTGQSPGSSAVSLASADNHSNQHQEVPSSSVPPSAAAISSSPAIQVGKKNNNIFGKLFDRKKKENTPTSPPATTTTTPNIHLVSPKTPTFNSPKTPTQPQTQASQTQVPPASPSGARHAKNLSASFTGAFRKSSAAPPASPNQSQFQGTSPNTTPNPSNNGINRFTGLLRPTSSAGRPSTATGVSPTRESRTTERRGGSRSRSRSRGPPSTEDLNDTTLVVDQNTQNQGGNSRFSTLSAASSTGGHHLAVPSQQQQPLQVPIIPIPPTLGIQPTLSTPGGPSVLASGAFNSFASKGYPPPKELGYGKGPAMYVWVIRRWIKGSGEKSFISGLTGGGGLGLGIRGLEGMPNTSSDDGDHGALVDISQIEVRVEWKRGGKKAKRRRIKEKKARHEETEKSASRRSSAGNSELAVPPHKGPSASNTSLALTTTSVATGTTDGGEEGPKKDKDERKKKHRTSTISISSLGGSTEGGLFRRGSRKSHAGTETDDGEDSDPEDSETPWTCTVKVRKLGATRTGGGSRPGSVIVGGGDNHAGTSGPIKVKAGTLSPTPHHPKVVAMLKVPFPLPDVEVEKMNVKKREGKERTSMIPPTNTSPGSGKDDVDFHRRARTDSLVSPGLVVTAEEIKDVVCSTGMWLVVREGFGGVGKVSRKGDGWRIRA
ncbi:hypothetical protein VNI00_007616 [Paramarasmius palmivorus]|uniref:Uncharacterized protein n=1 Tax=Paramarasmius palmivorus TaxID=297713 RepID=A0AAW0D3D9_9AGAR